MSLLGAFLLTTEFTSTLVFTLHELTGINYSVTKAAKIWVYSTTFRIFPIAIVVPEKHRGENIHNDQRPGRKKTPSSRSVKRPSWGCALKVSMQIGWVAVNLTQSTFIPQNIIDTNHSFLVEANTITYVPSVASFGLFSHLAMAIWSCLMNLGLVFDFSPVFLSTRQIRALIVT